MVPGIDRKAIMEMGEKIGYERENLAKFRKETIAEMKTGGKNGGRITTIKTRG